MKRRFFGLLLIPIVIVLFCSWGFLVHRTVNQLAIYKLPKSIQPFFYRHMDYLAENSTRPDTRRNTDSMEATRHFIDLEVYGDSAAWKMPAKWEDAVKIFSEDTLLKYGYVPYHIITIKNKLTQAFRMRNKDSILFYAADLGHYIGDANVPLHTTLNYDGQLTDQKGLHSLWESMVPEIELDQYSLYSRHNATYLADPEAAIWKVIRWSYTLTKDVFEQETEATKDFTDSTKYRTQVRNGRTVKSYTSAFAKAYSKRLGKTINEQLLSSSNLIADFWYTAWVDAGKPDLSDLSSTPFMKEDKKILKAEKKSYRKNELLQKKLLIARKKVRE